MNESITAMAVLKAAEKTAKNARGKIPVGEHEIDLTVRITGSLKQGDEYTQRFVQKACPWTLLALALDRLPKGEHADILRAGAKAALGGEKPDASEIKKTVEEEIERLGGATTKMVDGRVTHSLTFEVVAIETTIGV